MAVQNLKRVNTGIIWVIKLFTILIVWIPDPSVARTVMLTTPEVSIHHAPILKNAAREAARFYKQVKVELEETFGWYYPVKPQIILVKNNNDFKEITRYSYIVALAIPSKNLIIIDYSKMGQGPFSFKKTIKHEVCHLMLHHHISEARLPKWLDEGIAQWVSDGMMELFMHPKQPSLDDAVLAGRYIPLENLRYRFPQDRGSLWLAYQESKSIVAYIEKRFGRAALFNLLNNLKAGGDFDTAVYQNFSISVDTLEKNWQDELKNRTRFFSYVATHIYEFIFVLAALLTVVGFVRFLLRKSAYTDDDPDVDDEH